MKARRRLLLAMGLSACTLPNGDEAPGRAAVPNVAAISGDAPAPPPARLPAPRPDPAQRPALATDADVRSALGLASDALVEVLPWHADHGFVAFAHRPDLEAGLRGGLAVLDEHRRLRAHLDLDLTDVCPGDADRCEKAWLDLAPFRIADDEVAVGLRVRVYAAAATGVGTDDKLLLFRVVDDTLVRIAKIHMASDWTRARESTVLIVSRHRHEGLFDLLQRGEGDWSIGVGEAREDGREQVRITWEFDGERYVIRSSGEEAG
jgi:hypothetical protein